LYVKGTGKRRFEIGHNLIKLLQPFSMPSLWQRVCRYVSWGRRRRLPEIKVKATLHLRPINEWFKKGAFALRFMRLLCFERTEKFSLFYVCHNK
jgi:hypothetical protein